MKSKLVSGFALLLAMGLATPPAHADLPPLIDCPASSRPGDSFGREGFYVPSYPGINLRDVTLYMEFPAAGSYSLSLTARRDTFDGPLVGQAGASVVVGSDLVLYVVFHFNGASVPPGSTLTFQHAIVSGGGNLYYGVNTAAGCPVVETNDFNAPLSTFRRSGVAVRITGDPDPAGSLRTLTIAASASIHGASGTFFHSDIDFFNLFPQNATVTARYRCFAGQNCGTGTATFVVNGYAGKNIKDAVATLFGSHETAGAIEMSYRNFYGVDGLHAVSRVYTPEAPAPTNGASVPALPGSAATGSAIFVGMGNNGGNRSAGFRTNAGAYNPWARNTLVTFTLYRNTGKLEDASRLGTVTQTWGPNEAKQLNDIFAVLGAGATVTTDAILFVGSDLPIFAYTTVIDNVTGDSVVQGPTSF